MCLKHVCILFIEIKEINHITVTLPNFIVLFHLCLNVGVSSYSIIFLNLKQAKLS
jgi:hypothetical protein